MEWTKSDKIHTAFPQSDKLGYHIYNLCGIQYPVYGGLVYHCECEDRKTRPISDGFRKNNVNYWAFREIRSIIPHL